MRKTLESPGRMKNSSYYISPAGDRTHDLPQTIASNIVKGPTALTASVAVRGESVHEYVLLCGSEYTSVFVFCCIFLCFS